jgi:hypothetical protein
LGSAICLTVIRPGNFATGGGDFFGLGRIPPRAASNRRTGWATPLNLNLDPNLNFNDYRCMQEIKIKIMIKI